MGKVLEQKEIIARFRAIHGDYYDYSKVEYKGRKYKVCIICPIHGELWITPEAHLAGHGCKRCQGRVFDTESFIEKARLIHGDEFDYSLVNYISSDRKVCIICKRHGVFWMRPNGHLNGQKCPKCSKSLKGYGKVFGVGVMDEYESAPTTHQNIWRRMLKRCYYKPFLELEPTYMSCNVCDEWLIYSNFKRWSIDNYIEGWHLDKDLLSVGVKIYSPATCLYIPPWLNLCINSIHKNLTPYYKNGWRIHGKWGKGVVFHTKQDAILASNQMRRNFILSRAEESFNNREISAKIFDSIINYLNIQ